MRIIAFLLAGLLIALTVQAEVHHSSDFGWEAEQDVSEEFAGVVENGKLGPGDQLVLEDTYRISGTHHLPDNFTLSAVRGGGFEVTDATEGSHGPFLVLGNSTTLHNLTVKYLNTPELGPHGTNPQHEKHFARMTGIAASGKKNIRIENCRLVGSIGHHLKFSDRCERPRIIGCHILGGYWTILLSAEDALFRECLVERYQGDGIKTVWAKSTLVENCVFQDGARDGIDTTGGFDDSVVRDTLFRRLGVSGLDLKSHYGKKSDLDSPENVGILVENCTFLDMPNAIVFTTLDREGFLDATNAEKYAPHDVDIMNCAVGHVEEPKIKQKEGGYGVNYPTEAGEHMRMLLVKDAHSIRYRNARFYGERIQPVYFHSIGGSRHLSEEAAQVLNYGVHGTVAGPAPAGQPGNSEAPFECGPQPLD